MVSTSLCGDGYVDGLPVAALSWQAGGPLARRDHARKAWADPETLVAMQPDILLLGPGESVSKDLLPDTRIISLDWAEDMEGIRANQDKLAELGEDNYLPLQSSELIEPAYAPAMLYLSRAGGTAGPGTYVDAAIRLAGGHNLVTQGGWFTPDPEWIVAQDPDIVVTSFRDAYASVNAPLARNRAVMDFIADRPVIDVPGKLWPCAGPSLAEAVAIISDGVKANPG